MTDTQVEDTTSTPDEAVKYEPIPASSTSETVTEDDLAATPEGTEAEAKVDLDWVAQKREQEQVAASKKSGLRQMVTEFPDGIVIGWDMCAVLNGGCGKHVSKCDCKTGPKEPKVFAKWRAETAWPGHKQSEPNPTTVRKAVVTADPNEVAAKVEEATTDDTTPTGRKRRSDAGKPRGPRKDPNATPESVAEAAGNLSAALSKE